MDSLVTASQSGTIYEYQTGMRLGQVGRHLQGQDYRWSPQQCLWCGPAGTGDLVMTATGPATPSYLCGRHKKWVEGPRETIWRLSNFLYAASPSIDALISWFSRCVISRPIIENPITKPPRLRKEQGLDLHCCGLLWSTSYQKKEISAFVMSCHITSHNLKRV